MTRSALEALFARQAQGRVFLWMLCGGMVWGLAVTVSGAVTRRWRLLGAATDVLCALLAGGMTMAAAFLSGDGLRLYALLGLLLGAVLYRSGVQPLVDAVISRTAKIFRRRQE